MPISRFPDKILVVRDQVAYSISPAELQIGDVVAPYKKVPSWHKIIGQNQTGWVSVSCPRPYCRDTDYGNPALNFGLHGLAWLARKLEG